MDRRRLSILLLLALAIIILLGGAGFLIFGGGLELLGLTPTATPTTPPPTAVLPEGIPSPVATVDLELDELVEVVVSLQTVPRGFQMSETELSTELRLAADVNDNMVRSIDEAVGLFARTDIYQGETLTYDSLVRDLTLDGQLDYGPSSLIPPGYLAMSVPLDRLGSVAYGIEGGDFVDILVTFILFPVDEQFQSRLPNDATFFLENITDGPAESSEEGGSSDPSDISSELYTLSPYGRFETLADGSIVHVSPAESTQRGVHVSFVIQNAKVIQVGPFEPPLPPQLPTATPTPDPNAESGEFSETPEESLQPTPIPPADVVVVALPPQQQLVLKYAVETNSIIDYALRGVNDGELYAVDNVTFDYIVDRFNVEIPPDFAYIVNTRDNMFVKVFIDDEGLNPELVVTVIPTPEQIGDEASQNTSGGEDQ
ncbi:MAG: hypothetical protein QNJ45_09960 [Ardenticatenaceae bacterium]|nr:hypothetical protein [Ardenticatenaceae bacterium]